MFKGKGLQIVFGWMFWHGGLQSFHVEKWEENVFETQKSSCIIMFSGGWRPTYGWCIPCNKGETPSCFRSVSGTFSRFFLHLSVRPIVSKGWLCCIGTRPGPWTVLKFWLFRIQVVMVSFLPWAAGDCCPHCMIRQVYLIQVDPEALETGSLAMRLFNHDFDLGFCSAME